MFTVGLLERLEFINGGTMNEDLKEILEGALIFLVIVVAIFAVVYVVITAGDNYRRQYDPHETFCNGTLLKTYHTVSYCDGHPFVCEGNKCNYVTVYEDCYSRSNGKTSITECEAVSLQWTMI